MLDVVSANGASLRTTVLAHLDRLGVYAEHVFAAVYGRRYSPTDFLSESVCNLAALIVLPARYKVRKKFPLLCLEAFEQIVLAVHSEGLGRDRQGYDFEVGEFRDDASSWDISELVNQTPCKLFENVMDFFELCNKVVHNRCICNVFEKHY